MAKEPKRAHQRYASKKYRDWEYAVRTEEALINACGNNPELPYFLGVMGSAGIFTLSALLEPAPSTQANDDLEKKIENACGVKPRFDYQVPEPLPEQYTDQAEYTKYHSQWEKDRNDAYKYFGEHEWKKYEDCAKAVITAEHAIESLDTMEDVAKIYAFLLTGPAGYIVSKTITQQLHKSAGDSSKEPFDKILDLVQAGSATFGTFCATVLILKAIFGGEGQGIMGKLL